MLYIDDIGNNTIRFGNAPGGGTYTKYLSKPLEANADLLGRVWIRDGHSGLSHLNCYDPSQITLNGTVYDADDFVNEFNILGTLLNSSSPEADIITITTTLTGEFIARLLGIGDVVITYPDLTNEVYSLPSEVGDPIIKSLVGGGVITISNPSAITYIDISGKEITSVDGLHYCVNIEHIISDKNLLTSFTTYALWNRLQSLQLYNNPLTEIIHHSEWVDLTYIDHSGCALTESSINNILIALDESGIMAAEIWLDGGTNATPTGLGVIAYDSLVLKGNTVTCNGYPI